MPNNLVRGLMGAASPLVLGGTLFFAAAANAGVLPGHGHFTSGRGNFARHGGTLTVDQDSRTGIVNWNGFSVGRKNSVVFDNAGGATLNEIHGGNLSRIAGRLTGSGSVYLINNAGIVIGKSGRINTQGSFAASGANADNFGAGKRLHFTAKPKGNVIDNGSIVSRRGRVDLYGNRVGVHGAITARSAETSGERVNFNGAQVRANWLVDPKNLKVTASAASTIEQTLAHKNVTLKTTASSCSGPGNCSGGEGDILIDAPITWSGTRKLTLNAYDEINVNDEIHLTGKGALDFEPQHGDLLFNKGGEATFASTAASLTIEGTSLRLLGSIAALASHIASNPSGNFALSKDVNAASLGTFSSSPIPTAFTGYFEGLGHTISNLKISDNTDSYVGLFVELDNSGYISDLTLANADITSTKTGAFVGALAGLSNGLIAYVSSSGSVKSNTGAVGGLVGWQGAGDVIDSSSSANVKGGDEAQAGGLVGHVESGSVFSSPTSGNVSAGYDADVGGTVGYLVGTVVGSGGSGTVSSNGEQSAVGGVVGYNDGGTVENAATDNKVTGANGASVGGLVGVNAGMIHTDTATGAVSGGRSAYVGGLVGYNSGSIDTAFASGKVSGSTRSQVGGLIGENEAGTITASSATGAVSARNGTNVGGLIGDFVGGNIANVYATGNVSDSYTEGSGVGGLVGASDSGTEILDGHATGTVTDTTGTYDSVGGLVGYNDGEILVSYATGNVKTTGSYNESTGGFAGKNDTSGTITKNYATGAVSGGDIGKTGGFVGINAGSIADAYARGAVSNGAQGYAGGFAGSNAGGATIDQAYSTGAVTPGVASAAGGLVGDDASTGGITNAYWDRQTSGISAKSQGAGNVSNDSGITGLTTSQLKGGMATGLSASIWTIDNTKNNGFPYLTQNPPN